MSFKNEKRTKKASQLLTKEQEFKEMNAALEERTASLINEAESVFRGQEILFNDLDSMDNDFSSLSFVNNAESLAETKVKPPSQVKPTNAKNKKVSVKKRPISGPVSGAKKRETNKIQNSRPQSSKERISTLDTSPLALVKDRAMFADRINTMELEAEDDTYTPSHMNDEVLPEVASELGSDATIRFLKAKLRVMQEELENIAHECRQKTSKVVELQNEVKDSNEQHVNLSKKNEQLQKTIEKHKKVQVELQTKNADLEGDVSTIKKELDGIKRSSKQSSANKNTLEVRLNRALEEVEKYKLALKNSKDSSRALNDTDRKRLEHLQNDNKRLETQKSELMTAFKKQLKLIDVLKRQKMHIEAAKMLEFTEEEFIRALDWGQT